MTFSLRHFYAALAAIFQNVSAAVFLKNNTVGKTIIQKTIITLAGSVILVNGIFPKNMKRTSWSENT